MNKVKGVLFAVISAIAFGVSPILISMTYSMGNNFMMMAFTRNLLVIPFLLLYVGYRRLSLKLNKKQFFQMCLLTIVGICTSLMALYASYTFIPVALSSSIHFIYPTIVAVASVFLFKEKLSFLRKVALVCSLSGIMLMANFKDGSADLLKGVVLAIISGSAYSFYILYMAKSGLLRLPTIVVTFYTCIISSVFLGLVAVFCGKFTPFEMSLEGWLITLFISIMITILGTMFTQLAVRNVGTTITSVLSTLEPITTIIIGVLLYNETVGRVKLIASFLILMSVFLLALDQKNMARKRAKNIERYEDIIADKF